MRSVRLIIYILAGMCFTIGNGQNTNWGVQFSDAIIFRYQPTIDNMTKKGWEYSNSIVLHGMERIYEKTRNSAYFNYIKAYVDAYIGVDGTGVSAQLEQNLDVFHPGLLCLFLYEETGESKYKTAADLIRTYINSYPRNTSNGFWHKSNYPNQMWLDGIYMAEPFLAKYGYRMNDAEYCNNEATFQTLLLNSHAFDVTKKLLYHGWDESKVASWSNASTGVSPEVWSRALGWYAMALVDILKYIPDDHPMEDSMLHVLNRVAAGIKNYQDASTGLWYQVVDKGSTSGNWIETSGSGMFVYALKTAVDYGWIDTSYMSVVRKGWTGLQTKITTYTDNRPRITEFCAALGIRATYNEYIATSLKVSCPATSGTQHPHGYCAILLASSVMEYKTPKQCRLQVYTGSHGAAFAMTNELYHDFGTEVMIVAKPDAGYVFSHWSGDTTSTSDTLLVRMNSHKHITANFVLITGDKPSAKSTNSGLLTFHKTSDPQIYNAAFTMPFASRVDINVYDLYGKPVFTQTNLKAFQGRNDFLLHLDNARPGIYFCSIKFANSFYTKKLLKI
jgi:unsaturated rhamnogalacturonyl hydrolase